MEQTLEVRFLGTPIIMQGDEEKLFSYHKVTALVYYILLRKSVMRDELSGLLWSDKSEALARQNLRNAVYEAKKVLGGDIFEFPNQSVIRLNPKIKINIDVKKFEKDPIKYLELYRGEFLQGFYLKDALEYEDWYLNERTRLKGLYVDTLSTLLEEAWAANNYTNVIQYGRFVMKENPYDEELCMMLIEAEARLGKYEEAMSRFRTFSNVLEEELNERPSEKMCDFIKSLEKKQEEQRLLKKSNSYLRGRVRECERIDESLLAFLSGEKQKHLLLLGDVGSGKTNAKNNILSHLRDHINVVEVDCYEIDRTFLLHSWMEVVQQLVGILKEYGIDDKGDLDKLYTLFPNLTLKTQRDLGLMEVKEILQFDMVYHTLVKCLERVAESHKLIIVFEDIHWMDSLSLSLLNSIILHMRNRGVLFLITSQRTKRKEYQDFVDSLIRRKQLEVIPFKPLKRSEIRKLLLEENVFETVDEALLTMFEEDTEGNLLLLEEMIKVVQTRGVPSEFTKTMIELFQGSCMGLSEDEHKLLDFIALFPKGSPFAFILEYMQLAEIEVLDLIESLIERRCIVSTNEGNEVIFAVTHQKLRSYLQMKIASNKRRILHSYIAGLWASRLTHTKKDLALYSRLEYNLEAAGNLTKMGYYKLKRLMYYLNFSPESFTSLGDRNLKNTENMHYFTEANILAYLADVEDMMALIRKEDAGSPEFQELELMYHYLLGTYFIREGNFKIGLEHLLSLIEAAIEVDNREYLLKGYKEMIYYDMQVEDAQEMKYYIEEALQLAESCNYNKEIGVLYRMKGYNLLMLGQLDEAEVILKKSLAVFTITQTVARRYTLNIAASYNYLGEIERARGDLHKALDYYKAAIQYCPENQSYNSLINYYCNSGVVQYHLGHQQEALQCFLEADRIGHSYHGYWRLSSVKAYLALLNLELGREADGIAYMESALVYARGTHSSADIGILNVVKAKIKERFPHCKISTLDCNSSERYAKQALVYLHPLIYKIEKEDMEAIMEKYLNR